MVGAGRDLKEWYMYTWIVICCRKSIGPANMIWNFKSLVRILVRDRPPQAFLNRTAVINSHLCYTWDVSSSRNA